MLLCGAFLSNAVLHSSMADAEDAPSSEEEGGLGSENITKDNLLQQREFDRGSGLDLSTFLVGDAIEEAKSDEKESQTIREEIIAKVISEVEVKDEAMGQMINPFESPDTDEKKSPKPGQILRDGTVVIPPEIDSVSELSTEGEKRLHWSLMVIMIVIYSIFGTIIGTTLPPVLGAVGLIGLALFGLFLGEKWIPNPSMRLLGVTWVIIAMKLLYGFAIDAYHWGWLEGFGFAPEALLVSSLLAIVGINVVVAHHHDEDAISAQATLVLLALSSAVGMVFGEFGLAIMIVIATTLLHGLALMRNSGNLTSLGIAASNLWIGLHALSNDWELFGLEFINFSDPLLLFGLLAVVNGGNATMAAIFCKHENWFSSALKGIGLGKPGLWGVSIGLGLIGALLAIAAHRLETGYSLAQVVLLFTLFGGSYLSVRGVELKELRNTIIIPLSLFLLLLVVFEGNIIQLDGTYSNYSIFAGLAAIITSYALLRNQSAVSDHVLWMGSIAIIILLTLLVPASEESGGRKMLLGIALTCIGLGALAIIRNSPSIAGVSVLMPWLWIFLFATDLESRVVNADIIPIILNEWDLTAFIVTMIILQIPINLKLGKTGVNLAGRLLGMSEISSHLRDSGLMRLWNLGYISALMGILAVARPAGLPAEGLILAFGLLLSTHVGAELLGRHQSNPRFLLIAFGVAALWSQWRHGLDAAWPLFIALSATPLIIKELKVLKAWQANEIELESSGSLDGTALQPMPEQMLSLQMGFIAASAAIVVMNPVHNELNVTYWFNESQTGIAFVFSAMISLGLYLPKAAIFEKLLQPALSSIIMLAALAAAFFDSEQFGPIPWISISIMFVATGAWLAAQGEIRSGLRSIARQETRVAEYSLSKQISENNEASSVLSTQGTTAAGENLVLIDPKMIELAEKQKRRRKRSGSTGEMDLLVGDIHHKPIVVLVFVSGLLLGTSWGAFAFGQGEAMLIVGAVISMLFIGISRWRASSLNLSLPDVAGVELPIVWTLGGISLTYLAARLTVHHVSSTDQGTLLVLVLATVILLGFALIGRKDLPIRIPSALEWALYIFTGTRVISLLLGGRMPSPFTVNPFDGELLNWQLPWFGQEVVLLGIVFIWDWIEGQRLKRSLGDHRSTSARIGVLTMIVFSSLGPAALLGSAFSIRRSINWDQPAVGMFAVPFILAGFISMSQWIPSLSELTMYVGLIIAISVLLLVVYSVKTVRPPWTTAWLWDAQFILPVAAVMLFGEVSAVVVSLLIVSLCAWVCGVLQQRKGWRIVGAGNLLASWLAAIFSLQTSVDYVSLLIMLASTGFVLGIVTWLNQTYGDELAIN
ncbi:MAG: hypothetical protein CXT69_05420 [Methanobacteriota archaeon]|nr:MAG: hypothetical protein CXT69_05420 [Euryarchaeota archaeon]